MASHPIIQPLPDAPVRGEDRQEFAEKGNAMMSALPPFVDDANTLASWINDTAQGVGDHADAAVSAADTAESARDAAVAASGSTVYDDATEYEFPDTVIGSDGNTYRFIGTSPATGDDPVGSTTGNWLHVSTSLAAMHANALSF